MSQQQQRTSPFGVDKAYDWKDTSHNPRRRNVAAGAAMGTAAYAGLGGGLGAAQGAHQARRGLSLLHSVGAKPSAARSAGIVAGHAARGGGRGVAVLAPIGAIAGVAGGALSPAKRKRRKATVGKSAFGVEVPQGCEVGESNRRGPAVAASLAGGAVAGGASRRKVGKSAFGVELPDRG